MSADDMREYKRLNLARNRKARSGLCHECSCRKPPVPGRTRCQRHLELDAAYARARRAKG